MLVHDDTRMENGEVVGRSVRSVVVVGIVVVSQQIVFGRVRVVVVAVVVLIVVEVVSSLLSVVT